MLRTALLASEIMLAEGDASGTPERQELLKEAKLALAAGFGRLDPTRQAWALAVMNRKLPVEAIRDIARKSDHRLVRLAFVMTHLNGAEDPMIDALRRGDDEPLRQVAEAIVALSELIKKVEALKKAGPATAPASR